MPEQYIARRMERIVPFYVMDLLAKAKQLEAAGRSVIHMEIGQPDFAAPPSLIAAGKAAIDAGKTGYTPATGIPELRRAIARHYLDCFGLTVDPQRIIVTPGSSGGLQLLMGVLINPGQEVLMTDPGYPCNKNFVEFVSGVPVSLPVGSETDYQLTAALVEQAWTERTRAVMVASPANPTGTVLSRQELQKIYKIVRERGALLIVDEIYQGLIYELKAFTALDVADDIFVLNSFSKYFGMTGWRLGWIVVPPFFVEHIDCLAQNIFLSCSTPAQYAALQAFSDDCLAIFEERRQAFRRRRDFLLPALQEIGFSIPVVPGGAFYLYADCSRLTNDSFTFAYDLLAKEGVAVTPGKDFGSHRCSQHIRFAYTNSVENMAEGVRRIERYLAAGNKRLASDQYAPA
jgi:aspartate/methionine/tyrosine aminotransferase